MDKFAIVSRYKENISWVQHLNCNYKIYNKGNEIHLPSECLTNVGRESQTFLNFIVNNYHNIKDSTLYCFLQGNPFDHLITIDDINNASNEGFKSFGKRNFTEPITASVNKHFPRGIPVIEFCDILFKRNIFLEQREISFILGGQFSVSGRCIKNRCLGFYRFLLDAVGHNKNPIEGHIMERIWHIVFNENVEDRFTEYFKKRDLCVRNANWGGAIQ